MSEQSLAISSIECVRGDRVAGLMWAQGLTNTTLAARIGVNRTLVSQKRNSKRPWYLWEIVRIADALDTTVAYLLGETKDSDRSLAAVDQVEWAEFKLWRARRASIAALLSKQQERPGPDGAALRSYDEIPTSSEIGISGVVAGAGFEPATSGL